MKITSLFLILFLATFSMMLVSCVNDYAVATPGYYKPASPVEQGSEFGVFIKRGEKLTPPPVSPQK